MFAWYTSLTSIVFVNLNISLKFILLYFNKIIALIYLQYNQVIMFYTNLIKDSTKITSSGLFTTIVHDCRWITSKNLSLNYDAIGIVGSSFPWQRFFKQINIIPAKRTENIGGDNFRRAKSSLPCLSSYFFEIAISIYSTWSYDIPWPYLCRSVITFYQPVRFLTLIDKAACLGVLSLPFNILKKIFAKR